MFAGGLAVNPDRFRRSRSLAVTMLALSACTAAPSEEERRSGQALAEQLCAGCHAVGAGGASPLVAAPPFRDLVRRWPLEELAEALAEGIAVGHEGREMPVFAFQPEEIDALLAYLEALGRI